MPDQVTVIGGSGALGYGLALRLAAAGVPVVIGSRDADRAPRRPPRASREQVPDARASRASRTARPPRRARSSFLCVPFRNQSETLTNLKNHLREGQLLVDATVPLAAAVSGKATRMLGVWQGSAAQQAAEMVPDGVRVVAALHTVNAPALKDLDPRSTRTCSSAATAAPTSARVAELIELIPGLRCVDAGRLEMARIAESLTALLIGVNARYKTHAGIRLTGLPDRAVVVLLAGGTGGAKLARGLLDVVGDELVVIANTGDDVEIYGAHVSPDPDLVTFWLADRIDERGWGLAGDTFHVMDGLRELGDDVWFNLGDRDLALCVRRARRLRRGRAADRGDRRGRARRSASARACCRCATSRSARTCATRRAGTRFQEFMIRERAAGPGRGRRASTASSSARPTPRGARGDRRARARSSSGRRTR